MKHARHRFCILLLSTIGAEMRLVSGYKRQVGINRNVVNGTHHIFTKRRLIAVNFPSKALLVPLFFSSSYRVLLFGNVFFKVL